MRERKKGTKDSLAGMLLLAHPVLRDPNFRRTVVLMSAHNGDGAMGVVLNRPLGRRLGEVNGEFALGPLSGVPVFSGGPVQTEQLLIAAWQTRADGFRLHFAIEPEKATQLLGETGVVVRAFLGYSGWSAGQLETEMEHSTWVVADAPADLFGRDEELDLWRELLTSAGEEWRLLADEPEWPERN